MALTADGRLLTERHRRAQVALAGRADAAARGLWPRLDVADLDASTPAWLAANLSLAGTFYQQSSQLAAAYVSEYRQAEIDTRQGPIVRPPIVSAEMATALVIAGPVRVKLLVGRGASGATAYAGALNKFTGIMRRQVLSGGRLTIDATTRADTRAIGWRRVTDGNPCTFCAMLASRGPVYASRERSEQIAGSGLRYHGHCGCTGEIVYGSWTPNEREQQYIEAYEKAAQQADELGLPRTQDTVLPRMRAEGIFRDSPLSRNK